MCRHLGINSNEKKRSKEQRKTKTTIHMNDNMTYNVIVTSHTKNNLDRNIIIIMILVEYR